MSEQEIMDQAAKAYDERVQWMEPPAVLFTPDGLELRLQMTQEDVDGGVRCSNTYCPVARCVRRTLEAHFDAVQSTRPQLTVEVSGLGIYVSIRETGRWESYESSFRMQDPIWDWAKNFDLGVEQKLLAVQRVVMEGRIRDY